MPMVQGEAVAQLLHSRKDLQPSRGSAGPHSTGLQRVKMPTSLSKVDFAKKKKRGGAGGRSPEVLPNVEILGPKDAMERTNFKPHRDAQREFALSGAFH